MKITVVVDANPIIAALIGGTSRSIFFDRRFRFCTTKHTVNEVQKYIPYISEKSGIEEDTVEYALSLLPIHYYSKESYTDKLKKAEELIGFIDKKDVNILSLALMLHAPLWSEDRDFEKVEGITLLKTKDLI
ncbi:MAG: PIN domain-containing protein [Euryarchaeota archaeon]|nr:PIN domain-containing protein [Euryarchaeota archaeon]